MARRPHEAEVSPRSLLVVCASFVVTMLVAVVLRCTGVLFLSFQSAFECTAAQTGAISSIINAGSCFGCTLGGVLVNHFGCRLTTIVGGVIYFIGMVGGSMTTTIHQMYALGAIAGLGNGVAYNAAMVVVAQYFSRYYAASIAFATVGVSVGTLAFPPIVQLLLDSFGWRGTLLITGAIVSNICVAGTFYRPIITIRNGSEQDKLNQEDTGSELAKRKLSRCTNRNPLHLAARELRLKLLRQSYCFTAFCFSKMLSAGSYSCYLLYLIPRATKSGITDQRASFLISITGICGLVGRILCGPISQKIPSLVLYQASMFLRTCAVLVAQGGAYAHLAASSAIMGVSTGFQLSSEKVMVREFVGVDNIASAVGIYYLSSGVAELIAPILAGALYDATQSYPLLFYVFAALFFVGFLGILTVPALKIIEPGVTMKGIAEIKPNEEEP